MYVAYLGKRVVGSLSIGPTGVSLYDNMLHVQTGTREDAAYVLREWRRIGMRIEKEMHEKVRHGRK